MKYLFGILLGVLMHMSYAKSTKTEIHKAERNPQNIYDMVCQSLEGASAHYIHRCESTEAVCMISHRTGLQCKFK